jgi:methylenetetrahydrofolate dehydrogenase (NADP+)/methenyltetrahydrofolate cyclohydrolase
MTDELHASPAGRIVDGKQLAARIQEEVRQRIDDLVTVGRRPPGLAIVLVGEDPASQVYVRNKSRACRAVGIEYFDHPLPADVSGDALLELVEKLNADPEVDGILVQLPLPGPLRELEPRVMELIDPMKDVDGFHVVNVGLLHSGQPRFVPCTALGVLEILDRSGVALSGANAVVVGRSATVGKPTAALLTQRNATVTICHSKTRDLAAEVARADVLVAAIGRPELIRGEWIKPGAAVIDVGINRVDGRLVGDVAFEAARARASIITPVPGGVGPMTIALLMRNCLQARLMHPDS